MIAWWLALVDEVNYKEKDVSCKFMHPRGAAEHFHWPA